MRFLYIKLIGFVVRFRYISCHLTECVHARPVDVSHSAAVNDDVAHIFVRLSQAAILFLFMVLRIIDENVLEEAKIARVKNHHERQIIITSTNR